MRYVNKSNTAKHGEKYFKYSRLFSCKFPYSEYKSLTHKKGFTYLSPRFFQELFTYCTITIYYNILTAALNYHFKRPKDGYKVTVKISEANSKSGKIYLLATMKYTWCAYLLPPFTGVNHYSL